MQIEKFEIKGLFGAVDRVIPFGTHDEGESALSLVLLHGPNGSGKTTSLRMIDGLMDLNLNVFRNTPFSRCSLRFSTGDELLVSQEQPGMPLHVSFGGSAVVLHPRQSGPHKPSGVPSVHSFRESFFSKTQNIAFEFIHTRRDSRSTRRIEEEDIDYAFMEGIPQRIRHPLPRRRQSDPSYLAERVARFIADAQVNYRRFFLSKEPDFFSAIIERLQASSHPNTTTEELLQRLDGIRTQEETYARLGVEKERWDFEQARGFLRGLSEPNTKEGLSVMTAAAEVLESRAREKQLLGDRLLTFERIVNGYFSDKNISIDPRKGFVITSASGDQLTERNLSSGEYHLLYLMVAALETQRRGTVLAIDEPELSMHISWQSRLISSLVDCASNASPQLLLSTHSPDIVGDYRDYIVEFGDIAELER